MYKAIARVHMLYMRYDAFIDLLTGTTFLLASVEEATKQEINGTLVESALMAIWSPVGTEVDAEQCIAKSLVMLRSFLSLHRNRQCVPAGFVEDVGTLVTAFDLSADTALADFESAWEQISKGQTENKVSLAKAFSKSVHFTPVQEYVRSKTAPKSQCARFLSAMTGIARSLEEISRCEAEFDSVQQQQLANEMVACIKDIEFGPDSRELACLLRIVNQCDALLQGMWEKSLQSFKVICAAIDDQSGDQNVDADVCKTQVDLIGSCATRAAYIDILHLPGVDVSGKDALQEQCKNAWEAQSVTIKNIEQVKQMGSALVGLVEASRACSLAVAPPEMGSPIQAAAKARASFQQAVELLPAATKVDLEALTSPLLQRYSDDRAYADVFDKTLNQVVKAGEAIVAAISVSSAGQKLDKDLQVHLQCVDDSMHSFRQLAGGTGSTHINAKLGDLVEAVRNSFASDEHRALITQYSATVPCSYVGTRVHHNFALPSHPTH